MSLRTNHLSSPPQQRARPERSVPSDQETLDGVRRRVIQAGRSTLAKHQQHVPGKGAKRHAEELPKAPAPGPFPHTLHIPHFALPDSCREKACRSQTYPLDGLGLSRSVAQKMRSGMTLLRNDFGLPQKRTRRCTLTNPVAKKTDASTKTTRTMFPNTTYFTNTMRASAPTALLRTKYSNLFKLIIYLLRSCRGSRV